MFYDMCKPGFTQSKGINCLYQYLISLYKNFIRHRLVSTHFNISKTDARVGRGRFAHVPLEVGNVVEALDAPAREDADHGG